MTTNVEEMRRRLTECKFLCVSWNDVRQSEQRLSSIHTWKCFSIRSTMWKSLHLWQNFRDCFFLLCHNLLVSGPHFFSCPPDACMLPQLHNHSPGGDCIANMDGFWIVFALSSRKFSSSLNAITAAADGMIASSSFLFFSPLTDSDSGSGGWNHLFGFCFFRGKIRML